MTASALSPDKLKAAREGIVERKSERLSSSLSEFVKGGAYDVVEDVVPGPPSDLPLEDSYLDWNWHHDAICRALELVTEGEIKRLCINLAPGTLKSQLVNVYWPAWEWAQDPSIEGITASTNAGNSKRDCQACRDLVKSEWFQRYFEFQIRKDQDGKTDFASTAKGQYKATSVGSKDIGSHWDRIRVDDPLGPREAYSRKKRQEAISWFREVMSDRLNDPKRSAIVVFGHRVHDKDLFDVLRESGSYEWLVIEEEYDPTFHESTILAQSEEECAAKDHCVGVDPREEDGELLHEARRGPVEIDEFKQTHGVSMSSAKLAQRPTTPGGEVLKGDWLQLNWVQDGPRPSAEDGQFMVFCDPKQGSDLEESSRASIQLWWRDARNTKDATMAAFVAERFGVWNQPETLRAFRKLMGRFEDEYGEEAEFRLWDWHDSTYWQRADEILVENKADGPAIQDHLQDELTVPIRLAKPWASKRQRIEDSTGYWSSGSVYLPPAEVCPTIDSFVSQAVKYPRGEHDDRIDCAAYAIQHLLGHRMKVEENDTGGAESNFGWRSEML